MKTLWMLPVILAAALVPTAAMPSETEPPPSAAMTDDSKAQALADQYKTPVADVKALREKGMGWGEIRNALAISQKSGKPLGDVMKLRDSGLGWGEIAKKYGFKLGDVVGRGHDRGRDHGRGGDGKDRDDGKDRGEKDRGHGQGEGRGRGR